MPHNGYFEPVGGTWLGAIFVGAGSVQRDYALVDDNRRTSVDSKGVRCISCRHVARFPPGIHGPGQVVHSTVCIMGLHMFSMVRGALHGDGFALYHGQNITKLCVQGGGLYKCKCTVFPSFTTH
jgi:hypothetical protein